MTTQGPTAGTTFANDASVGTVAWTIGGTSSVTLFGTTSRYLKATGFGFTIPGTATINGITLRIHRLTNAGAGEVDDNIVSLVKAGVASGNNKASAAPWPIVGTNIDYGGASDLWGLTLTPTDVNASDFGFAISCFEIGDGSMIATVKQAICFITVDYTDTTPPTDMKQWPSLGMMGFGS